MNNYDENGPAFPAIEPGSGVRRGEPREYHALARGLWTELTSGRCVVRSSLFSADRCFLDLEVISDKANVRPLRREAVSILRRVLLGETQKQLQIELGCSPSGIAMSCSECLSRMGFERSVLHTHFMLVRAAQMAGRVDVPAFNVTPSQVQDNHWIVSAERPEIALSDRLSRSEYEVLRMIIEGCSNSKIAQARKVSVRTVANQISSLFQKSKLSGRSALLVALVQRQLASAVPTLTIR